MKRLITPPARLEVHLGQGTSPGNVAPGAASSEPPCPIPKHLEVRYRDAMRMAEERELDLHVEPVTLELVAGPVAQGRRDGNEAAAASASRGELGGGAQAAQLQGELNGLLTVVVTCHNRWECLMRALVSCFRAGVSNVIIALSRGSDTEAGWLRDVLPGFAPTARLVCVENDANESWLAAVRMAITPYVAILHDDDQYAPGYGAAVLDALRSHPDYVVIGSPPRQGACMWLHAHDYSLTPIRGVFKRWYVELALMRARALPPSCYLRPGFLIGNDLLIWLTASEIGERVVTLPSSLVILGLDDGSTTMRDYGSGALPPRYRTTLSMWEALYGDSPPSRTSSV